MNTTSMAYFSELTKTVGEEMLGEENTPGQ
jgi:hypothetical protein